MSSNKEMVVLVDEKDNPIGTMEKMEAHEKGVLHRAFSVLLFNEKQELLLQQRALTKYHCAGLWTNTVCSHPYPEESVETAAHRRLMQEMGIRCNLVKTFEFVYKANFENGLTEHEFDHVFVGRFSGVPTVNQDEVANWKYISMENLKMEIEQNPAAFTPWFRIIVEKMYENEPNWEQIVDSQPL